MLRRAMSIDLNGPAVIQRQHRLESDLNFLIRISCGYHLRANNSLRKAPHTCREVVTHELVASSKRLYLR